MSKITVYSGGTLGDLQNNSDQYTSVVIMGGGGVANEIITGKEPTIIVSSGGILNRIQTIDYAVPTISVCSNAIVSNILLSDGNRITPRFSWESGCSILNFDLTGKDIFFSDTINFYKDTYVKFIRGNENVLISNGRCSEFSFHTMKMDDCTLNIYSGFKLNITEYTAYIHQRNTINVYSGGTIGSIYFGNVFAHDSFKNILNIYPGGVVESIDGGEEKLDSWRDGTTINYL